MIINRGYITAGGAGLIVFIVGSALITTAFFANYYTQKADDPHIYREPNMCVIRVEAPCGDDICRYKASVPCDALEKLIKSTKEGK